MKKAAKESRNSVCVLFFHPFFLFFLLCMCTQMPSSFYVHRAKEVSTLCFILIPIYILFPQKKIFFFVLHLPRCICRPEKKGTRYLCILDIFWWFYFNIRWLFRRTRVTEIICLYTNATPKLKGHFEVGLRDLQEEQYSFFATGCNFSSFFDSHSFHKWIHDVITCTQVDFI